MELRSWSQDNITPVVLVLATPEAEEMCQKPNGLTIVDLLRPLGVFRKLNFNNGVPVRSVGDTSYRIREFSLRFHYASSIQQPPSEAAETRLHSVISAAAADPSLDDPPDILAAAQKGELPEELHWFQLYRQELLRSLAFSDHETYDLPVATLLVLHGGAPSPADALSRLQGATGQPPLVRQGLMQAPTLRHCLVLADARQPDFVARAEQTVRAVRGVLGPQACTAVTINSGGETGKGASARQDLFHQDPFQGDLGGPVGSPGSNGVEQRPLVPPEGLGCCLSKADLEGVARALEDFAVQALLPTLETQLRSLNTQVAAARTGLRNQLKGLLWRSKGSSGSRLLDGPALQAAMTPAYGPGTLEGQMRSLADLAFMLQDYRTCAATLRLLGPELKSDKAWKHYAGVQEMLGIAEAMLAAPLPEVIGHFREAFHRYSTLVAGSSEPRRAVHLATRAMMLAAVHAQQHRSFHDAHVCLMRAQLQEDKLGAALLLEQAAHLELLGSPPAKRKYAFHTVLAGLSYNGCGQARLGMHAYRQVMAVYRGQQWAYVEEHIHDTLGKQLVAAGEGGAALPHFLAQLPCPFNSPDWQQYYLDQFLSTLQEAQEGQEEPVVMDVPLPSIDLAHVVLHTDDHVDEADAETSGSDAAMWKLLEQRIMPGGDASSGSWLEGPARKLQGLQEGSLVVAGEALRVSIPLHNPMAVVLHISRLRVACTHEAASPDSPDPPEAFVEVQEMELVLRPGESGTVDLAIRPLRPGTVVLQGIAWVLQGAAHSLRPFPTASPAAPPSGAPAGRPQAAAGKGAQRLAVRVVDAMPRLQVELSQQPHGPLAEGQLHCCHVSLHNTGAMPLQDLRLAAAPTAVLLTQPHEAADSDPLAFLRGSPEGGAGTSPSELRMDGSKAGVSVYSWPPGSVVQQGAELSARLWLHPRTAGNLTLLLLWYYQPSRPNAGMRHRLLRMRRSFQVVPAMHVQPSLLPCQGDPARLLLRLDLHSAQVADREFSIRDVTCTVPGYRLQPRAAGQPRQPEVPVRLVPGQSSTVFYHVHPQPQAPGLLSSQKVASRADLRHWLKGQAQGPARPRPEAAAAAPAQQGQDGQVPVTPFAEPAAQGAKAQPLGIMLTWQAPSLGGGSPGSLDCGALHATLAQDVRPAVHVTVSAPPVQHDFASQPICVARVQLCFHNSSQNAITGTLCLGKASHRQLSPAGPDTGWQRVSAAEAPGQQSASDSRIGSATSSRHWWVGATQSLLPPVGPRRSHTCTLQVAVTAPGIYELSDYSLNWTSADPGRASDGVYVGRPFLLHVHT